MWRATVFTARSGHCSAFDSQMQFVVSLVIWRTWIPIFNFICHYLPTSKPLELDSILPQFGKCFSVGKTPPKPFGYASADLCHTSPPASTPNNTILCGTNCATLCGTTTIQKYFYHFFYFFQHF